jgi:UDP-glucose 4-epimerase
LAARKPAYGVAKEFAEKLTLLAGQTDMSSTVLRFWWAFGEEIGGRHLREMLGAAAAGKTLAVPVDCGGSFLSQEDFNLAVETIFQGPAAAGRVLNLASAYVGWDEVARMVVEVTGGTGGIELVPREAWTGAAFLADRWELDDGRIRGQLEMKPCRDASGVRGALRQAIGATWRKLQAKGS